MTAYIETITITVKAETPELLERIRIVPQEVELLVREGFFTFRSGHYTVHRNSQGKIGKVEKHYVKQFNT